METLVRLQNTWRQGTTPAAERHERELKGPGKPVSRALPVRVRRAFALLTKTHHGSRALVEVTPNGPISLVKSAYSVELSRMLTETDFGKAPIENVPHLFFPFDGLPHVQIEELIIEFPHKHTRSNAEVLEMFDIRLEEGASASRS